MQHTGATILRTLLERQGIHTLAGIPGGAILPFYDALHGSRIRHILTRHEQGAGFLAQGMARVTGRAAVCLATSGPGATNLLTAVADAQLDSVPLVAITGQVAQPLIGTDSFQEVDTYGLMLPITKHNFLVRSVDELLETVPQAFRLAESGRPGPVSIDIPKDVFTARADISVWPEPGRREAPPACPESQIEALAALLAGAERPLLYVGGGAVASDAAELVRELAHRLDAPATMTLNALGTFAADDSLNMGLLGMHGSKGTNLLMREADAIFAIGARFDDRATGKVSDFCPQAAIAHLDIDRAEHGKIRSTTLAIAGDAAEALALLLRRLPAQAKPAWRARAAELRAAHPLRHPPEAEEPLHPVNLIRSLARLLPSDAYVATDVGQHQMWVAQAFPFDRPRTLLTSGGLGTMGFGLPAAIGAALAAPGRRVACVSGDGSILMNIQELATLADLGLPVAVLVFNNAHLGLVRQQQELFYGGRYSASRFQSSPDFAAIARGFGLRGTRIDPDRDPFGQLAAALAEPGPCLIDIPIEATANVLPMVPPGAANHQTLTETPTATSHA